MRSDLAVLVSALLSVAAASPALQPKAACNADNCARAVTGTALGTATRSARYADCQSFMSCTVTPAAQTSTTYVSTITVTTPQGNGPTTKVARDAAPVSSPIGGSGTTNCPSVMPTYAAATCSAAERFASACSCFGATKAYTTLAAATSTATATATAYEPTCTDPTYKDWGPGLYHTYSQYFSTSGKRLNEDNPAASWNDDSGRNTYRFGSIQTTKCQAVNECARVSTITENYSFDLHYLIKEQKWECRMYFNTADTNAYYWDVEDPNVGAAYGYTQTNTF